MGVTLHFLCDMNRRRCYKMTQMSWKERMGWSWRGPLVANHLADHPVGRRENVEKKEKCESFASQFARKRRQSDSESLKGAHRIREVHVEQVVVHASELHHDIILWRRRQASSYQNTKLLESNDESQSRATLAFQVWIYLILRSLQCIMISSNSFALTAICQHFVRAVSY